MTGGGQPTRRVPRLLEAGEVSRTLGSGSSGPPERTGPSFGSWSSPQIRWRLDFGPETESASTWVEALPVRVASPGGGGTLLQRSRAGTAIRCALSTIPGGMRPIVPCRADLQDADGLWPDARSKTGAHRRGVAAS